ncbi:MAG: hypothetical protein HS115_08295 [Spirochaetales bacterium]|nr:hypothetical protein [Spirochaetales bacterium]
MHPTDISRLVELLDEDITAFDCAQLCRGADGMAYCCKTQNFVPVLYREEQTYWNERGAHWQEYPVTVKEEAALSVGQVFCSCALSTCQRDLRSLSCRTYPLEPYFGYSGEFLGLTFLATASEVDRETGRLRCPLSRQYRSIRQQFINKTTLFFDQLLALRPEEKEAYLQSSRRHRKRHRECGIQIIVLRPDDAVLEKINL